MTADQLRTAAVVFGVLTAILLVFGQWLLGLAAAILAGGAYSLAGQRRRDGSDRDR